MAGERIPVQPVRQTVPAIQKLIRITPEMNLRLTVAKAEWESTMGQSISMNSFLMMVLNEGMTALKS